MISLFSKFSSFVKEEAPYILKYQSETNTDQLPRERFHIALNSVRCYFLKPCDLQDIRSQAPHLKSQPFQWKWWPHNNVQFSSNCSYSPRIYNRNGHFIYRAFVTFIWRLIRLSNCSTNKEPWICRLSKSH